MAFEEKTEEQLRSEAVETLKGDDDNFDEEANEETIDRMVEKSKKDEGVKKSLHDQKTKTGKSLKDMTKGKDFYKKQVKEPKGKKDPKGQPKDEDINKIVDEKVNAKLEKTTLESLPNGDDVKRKIKRICETEKKTVAEALETSYIKHEISEEERRGKIDGSGVGGNGGSGAKKNLKDRKAEDFDCSTEQGQKDFEVWKKQTGRK